eukprot:6468468-Amphidinium_carterae.2
MDQSGLTWRVSHPQEHRLQQNQSSDVNCSAITMPSTLCSPCHIVPMIEEGVEFKMPSEESAQL